MLKHVYLVPLVFLYLFTEKQRCLKEEMMKLAAEMSLRESESSDPLGMMNK